MLAPDIKFYKSIMCKQHWMKKRIFVLRKLVKKREKTIFLLVLVCFRFMQMSNFPNFPSKENIRKQYLSANMYSCVNILSNKIAVRKDEMSYCNKGERFFASV